MAESNSIDTLPAALLTAAIDDQQFLKYLSMIGPTILAYDWLLNIDSELTHVWSRRWGVMEWLYLSSRYMPFADTTIMLLYHFFLVDPSIETCHIALSTQCWMYVIGMTISQQILMIRTWAFWERGKIIGLALFVELAITFVVSMYGTGSYVGSLTYFQGYNLGGCFVFTSSNIVYLAYGMLLLTEAIHLVLMLLKAYRIAKHEYGFPLLSKVILQDGVVFYIMLLVLLVVDGTVALQPGIISTVFIVPTRICHSIFASRVILHIRAASERRTNDLTSSLVFDAMQIHDEVGTDSLRRSPQDQA